MLNADSQDHETLIAPLYRFSPRFWGTVALRFLYWLVNTAGVGGALALLAVGGVLGSVGLTLRWLAAGAKADERATYPYPTHE